MPEIDYLEHFGVKGMKWGVVKKKASGAVSKLAGSGEPTHPAASDVVKVKALRKKVKSSSTDALSNEELQAVVNRMNLEQQYSRLRSGERTSLTAGASFISGHLSNDLLTSQVKGLAQEFPNGDKVSAAIDTAIVGAKIVDQLVNKKKK